MREELRTPAPRDAAPASAAADADAGGISDLDAVTDPFGLGRGGAPTPLRPVAAGMGAGGAAGLRILPRYDVSETVPI